MIIIQSINGDYSTTSVIKWLIVYGHKFLRINDIALIKSLTLTDGQLKLNINDTLINLNEYNSYWYRRGMFSIAKEIVTLQNKHLQKHLDNFISNGITDTLKDIENKLRHLPISINSYTSSTEINKLIILDYAKEVGLKTPSTLITTSKDVLNSFLKKHKRIITKPINNIFSYTDNENYWYPTYTTEVTEDIIESLPNNFPPSLFQELLEKQYEIRCFYINDKIYSAAIFSQKDPKTKIDSRNYNYSKPNRLVSFKLPHIIEEKVKSLMHKANFETGSIDLVRNKTGQYYFLEVNPIGQFGYMSYLCNYNIEKEIAKALIYEKK